MKRGLVAYNAGIFHIDHRADILFDLRRKGEVLCPAAIDPTNGLDGDNWHGELKIGEKCYLCGAVT